MQQGDNGYTERDWKLFRSKLPAWQEAYMEALLREYVDILQRDAPASERFWELEQRLKRDKRNAGVQVEMRRSQLLSNLAYLLNEGMICPDDLEDFSEGLKQSVLWKQHWLDDASWHA